MIEPGTNRHRNGGIARGAARHVARRKTGIRLTWILPQELSLREGEDLRRRRFRTTEPAGDRRRSPLPRRLAGSDGVSGWGVGAVMVERMWRVGAVVVLGTAGLLLILWALRLGAPAVSGGGPASAADGEVAERPPGTGALIERLRRTHLLNAGEIHDRLGLEGTSSASAGRGFLTHSPYEPPYRESCPTLADLRYPLPPHPQSYEWDEASGTFSFRGQEPVLDWNSSLGSDTEVCAVRFADLHTRGLPAPHLPRRRKRARRGSRRHPSPPLRHLFVAAGSRGLLGEPGSRFAREDVRKEADGRGRQEVPHGGDRPVGALRRDVDVQRAAHEATLRLGLHRASRPVERADERHGRRACGRGRRTEPLSGLRRTHLRPGFPVRGGTHPALLGADVGDPPEAGEIYAVDHWRYLR